MAADQSGAFKDRKVFGDCGQADVEIRCDRVNALALVSNQPQYTAPVGIR